MLGVGGALAYVGLFVAALRWAQLLPVMLGLLSTVIILQLFQNNTIFGVEGRSIVTAILAGYAFTANSEKSAT
ncbi:hypothetical protein SAMN04488556_1390 [Halostagnicola kamekurae]|uniref:Uncharacterized protein n=2 Tax=Halostagnicola kamekurae TaxID=619731 RepID=A0A1I6QNB4_9EURY|nr:hypothetical protein SAMN04488556_1390 [Halostagnicola kamekurae]